MTNAKFTDIIDLWCNFKYCETGNLYRIRRFRKPCEPYIPYTKLNSAGYFSVRINNQCKVDLHVAIWAYHKGRWPREGFEIDHIDRDKSHNWISNFRELTRGEQIQNTKLFSTNTSGLRNVCYHKASNSWRVVLMVNGVTTTKYFKEKEKAEEMSKSIISNLTQRDALRGSGDER